MYGFDLFIFAGAVAYYIVGVGALFLHRSIAIYDIYMGRKHAIRGHIVVMSIAALQLLVLTVLDIQSRWLFTAAFWPLGALIFAASTYLFVLAILESGPGYLVGAQLFGYHAPHRGKLWKRFKQPVAIGLTGLYLGLALLTGHLAYIFTALILGVGMVAFGFAVSAMRPKS